MSFQTWEEALIIATSDATAVANTTTETVVFANTTVPSGYMQNGRTLRLTAMGKVSTTSTPTLQFLLRWGGVTGTLIAKSVAVTQGSGITNGLWRIVLEGTVRSNGAAGTLMMNGYADYGSALTQAVGSATGAGSHTLMSNGGVLTPAVATLDFTADTALALSCVWGTASSSNTLTGLQYILEALN